MTYRDIEEAVWFVSDAYLTEHCAMVCRVTGRIHTAAEAEEMDEIPEMAHQSDDWIAVPGFQDLGCGRDLVYEFVAGRLPSAAEHVHGIFRKSGAYGRFKALLDNHGLLEEWFEFENRRREEAIRTWCRENDLDLIEDSNLG